MPNKELTVKRFKQLVNDKLQGMRDDDIVVFQDEFRDQELFFKGMINQSGRSVFYLTDEKDM